MEGQQRKSSIRLILICLVLITVAGTIALLSWNFIPREITVNSETLTETTTTSPQSPEKQFDILQASLNSAVHVVQEAPRFFFILGSKLLAAHEGDNDANKTSNVYSVVDKNATKNETSS